MNNYTKFKISFTVGYMLLCSSTFYINYKLNTQKYITRKKFIHPTLY